VLGEHAIDSMHVLHAPARHTIPVPHIVPSVALRNSSTHVAPALEHVV
jgi:hypothetical protein